MGEGNYPDDDDRFDNAPYFNFNDGEVKFNTNWVSNANENYGASSGFAPKSLFKKVRSPPQSGLLLTFLL